MQNDNPEPATVRSDRQKTLQLPDLLDPDLVAFLLGICRGLAAFVAGQAFGLKQPEVGVVALPEPGACWAVPAGPAARSRLLTEQKLRKSHRQFELSYPLTSMDKQRMRETGARLGARCKLHLY